MGMKFEKKLISIERKTIYIIVRVMDRGPDFDVNRGLVGAFSSEEKARLFLTDLYKNMMQKNLMIEDGLYGGQFTDELGINIWHYDLLSIEVDADYDEVSLIGHIPCKANWDELEI